MNTLTHSQAAMSGDLSSVGATAGRIARMNEARAFKASEKLLLDQALTIISTITMEPMVVAKLVTAINAAVEFDDRYAIAHGHYEIRLAILECMCRVDLEVNPEGEEEC